ncbi:MAG: glycosyltransferase family 4 protein [Pseudomonadota bacterium]
MTTMAIVCPPRGHFSPAKAGAIELDIYDAVVHSRFRDQLVVIGRETEAPFPDVPFHSVPATGGANSYPGHVIRALRDINPGFIEARQHMKTCSAVARAFQKTPNMLFRHSHTKTPKGPLQRWWRTRQYAGFDSIAIVSEFARSRFARDFPHLADRTYVAYNGIDSEIYHAKDRTKEPLILFAARLIPNKGSLPFVEAMQQVLAERPDWKAEVIGATNPDFDDFNRILIDKMEATPGLHFAGYKPFEETMDAFARAAIVVVPSLWEETFGRTAMEANAYSAALVSSGRGGLKEVSGDAALYMDDVSAETIAKNVLELIDNPAKREEFQRRGRQRTETLFDIRRTVAVIDDARAEVLRMSGQDA